METTTIATSQTGSTTRYQMGCARRQIHRWSRSPMFSYRSPGIFAVPKIDLTDFLQSNDTGRPRKRSLHLRLGAEFRPARLWIRRFDGQDMEFNRKQHFFTRNQAIFFQDSSSSVGDSMVLRHTRRVDSRDPAPTLANKDVTSLDWNRYVTQTLKFFID